MKLLKRIVYAVIANKKRKVLSKRKIFIEKGVIFNNNTKFAYNNKIYSGTQILNTEIGKGTYISYNSVLNNCKIGAFCSIAPSVNIIYGTHPTSKFISTHPSFFSVNKQAGFSFTKENLFRERVYANNEKEHSVVIGNDVWIGFGVSIMEGISIGDGAIIAAKALVIKDVPPYSVVAGVPAKIIKYRFSENNIIKLMKFKWWERDFDWLEKNHIFFTDIENIDKLLE